MVSSLVPKCGLLQTSRQNSHLKNQFGEDCPADSHLVSLTLALVFLMVPGPWPLAPGPRPVLETNSCLEGSLGAVSNSSGGGRWPGSTCSGLS